MEVIIIVVVGFLIIGPDRLPGVMKEIRAVRLAIKNAVADARKQIDGELGEEFPRICDGVFNGQPDRTDFLHNAW